MHLGKWDEVPVERQERIFGRRKISGAPLYATDPNASDELDPVYANDPQGRLGYLSVFNDVEGRPWHTACRVDKVGAQDQNINPNADLMAGSAALSVVDRIWRRKQARKAG